MRVLGLLAVCTALLGAGTSQAAELAAYPRHHRSSTFAHPAPDGVAAQAYAGDAVLAPPCEDDSPAALITCGPSIQLSPEADDLRAQNVFSGIRPVQKLPYRQLFTWSR